MTELESISKLKRAGKLHFWRGTIEISEYELHEICAEIQAEHDEAVVALNKAAGNWAKADAELGSGTCKRMFYKPTGVLVCSECGAGMPKQLDKYCYLHFCPNCGRKVVGA